MLMKIRGRMRSERSLVILLLKRMLRLYFLP